MERGGIPFIGTDREVDIANPEALDGFAGGRKIEWIINCAAYTAVDKAEDDACSCLSLNAFGAGNIALCAEKIGAKLIHISTDYVFDGKGIKDNTGSIRPYREDDETSPSGVYGLTKRDGEIAVLKNNSRSLIIRTAWLYGRCGNNFVHTMLRLMNERDEIKVVNDQYGSPTRAFDLCETILAAAEKEIPFGIYHYTNEGEISWFDFAEEIYRLGRELNLVKKECRVTSCSSGEYPSKVKRPAYSVLDKSKIKSALKSDIPLWNESLGNYLKTCAA